MCMTHAKQLLYIPCCACKLILLDIIVVCITFVQYKHIQVVNVPLVKIYKEIGMFQHEVLDIKLHMGQNTLKGATKAVECQICHKKLKIFFFAN
jgi:hypothetical protein